LILSHYAVVHELVAVRYEESQGEIFEKNQPSPMGGQSYHVRSKRGLQASERVHIILNRETGIQKRAFLFQNKNSFILKHNGERVLSPGLIRIDSPKSPACDQASRAIPAPAVPLGINFPQESGTPPEFSILNYERLIDSTSRYHAFFRSISYVT